MSNGFRLLQLFEGIMGLTLYCAVSRRLSYHLNSSKRGQLRLKTTTSTRLWLHAKFAEHPHTYARHPRWPDSLCMWSLRYDAKMQKGIACRKIDRHNLVARLQRTDSPVMINFHLVHTHTRVEQGHLTFPCQVLCVFSCCWPALLVDFSPVLDWADLRLSGVHALYLHAFISDCSRSGRDASFTMIRFCS